MRKILTILLLFVAVFATGQDYRQIDWETNVLNVQQLGQDTFKFDVFPKDFNDPSAITLSVGNYFIDYVNRSFKIITSTSSTITVVDLEGKNTAPQLNQTGRIYASVFNQDTLFHSIGGVDLSTTDPASRWRTVARWNEEFARAIQTKQDTMPFAYVDLDTTLSNPDYIKGRTFWDTTKHAVSYYNDIADITVNLGLENLIRIYNNTGDTVPNGIVVAPSGDQFGNPGIVLADSRYKETSTLIAVTTHDIPPGTFGWVTKFGEVGGLNTLAYAGFKFLYLNGAGEITTTRQIGGHYETIIGSPGRIHATEGTIVVDIRTSAITVEQQGYTGWPDADDNSFPDNVGISLSPTTRTLILTATPASEYYHYQAGEKYVFTADTFIYSNIEGTHLLYYDEGEILEIINPTDSESRQVLERYPGIMNIYHSLTLGTFIYVNNEFHSFDMNGKTRGVFHDVHACTIIDPILLVDFSVDGTGNLDAHAQFGNLSGTIRNEDIKTVVPATSSTVGYSVFYKSGVSDWLRDVTNVGFGVINTGTGRIAYNEDVGGSWQLTEAVNGDYVYYLMLVSNTLGLKYGTVPGHDSYANEQDAVDGGLADAVTILQNLPIKEIAKVALVVYQTRDNYNNAVHGRIVSVTDPITGNDVDYIDLAIPGIGAGTGGVGANTLLDLTDGFASYAGRGDDIMVVNGSEDGFTSIPELSQSQITGLTDTISNHDTRIKQNASDINAIELDLTGNYVPYTGAISNVDIGSNSFTADGVTSGSAFIGGWSAISSYAVFSASNFNTATEYGVLQNSATGELLLNSPNYVGFRKNNIEVGRISELGMEVKSAALKLNGTSSNNEFTIESSSGFQSSFLLSSDGGVNTFQFLTSSLGTFLSSSKEIIFRSDADFNFKKVDDTQLFNISSSDGGIVALGGALFGDDVNVNTTGTGKVLVGEWGGGNSFGAIGFDDLSTGNANFYGSPSSPQLYINRGSGGNIFFRENNIDQMVLTSSGFLGVNTVSPACGVHVVQSSIFQPRGILSENIGEFINSGTFLARKARGSIGSPTAVKKDDSIGNLAFSGYDGVEYKEHQGIIQTWATEDFINNTNYGTELSIELIPKASGYTINKVFRMTGEGNLFITNSTTSNSALIGGWSANNNYAIFSASNYNTATGYGVLQNSGTGELLLNSSNYVGFKKDNVEVGRFASSGNLLINTTTDNGYNLDVNGTFRASGTAIASPSVLDAELITQGQVNGLITGGTEDADFNTIAYGGTDILEIISDSIATVGGGFWLDDAVDEIYPDNDRNIRLGNGTSIDRTLTFQDGTISDANADFRFFLDESTHIFALQRKTTGTWSSIWDVNFSNDSKFRLKTGVRVDEISDDGTLAGNASDVLVTERGIKEYVDAQSGDVFSGAKIYRSSDLSVTISTATITFDSEEYDTDSYHSTSTNTDRITIPETGYYLVTISGSLDASAPPMDSWTFSISKNGTGYKSISPFMNDAIFRDDIIFSEVFTLTAADYLQFDISSAENSTLQSGLDEGIKISITKQ